VDPRLRSAVDASVGWYEDLCTLHGVGSMLADGLWSSLAPPPPLHSDAVVVEPRVTRDQVHSALDGRHHCGFKDSFSRIDMSGAGMDLLFAASWIHRPPEPELGRASGPRTWSPVRDPVGLAEWTAHHDTAGVLLPELLTRGHFKVLEKRDEGEIVAGAVARLGSGVVDVSNVYAVPGHRVDWAELGREIGHLFPARPMVGYERGDDLEDAIEGGFTAVGDLRVWVR
jgi:hypothetical protein